MCTVTFIPIREGEFIFTSNRDETPSRSATSIISEIRADKRLLYPKDDESNGSWIIVSDSGQLVCILNGAFVRHHRKLPYRLSRGLMAKEFFSYPNAQTFIDTYIFEGIEPFTMIICDKGNLYELRWDGQHKHPKKLNTAQMYLWASATLYDQDMQEKRQHWFREWQNRHKEFNQSNILDFHRYGGEGNPLSDIVMNFNDIVKTTSITSIVSIPEEYQMRFESLETKEVTRHLMPKTNVQTRLSPDRLQQKTQ